MRKLTQLLGNKKTRTTTRTNSKLQFGRVGKFARPSPLGRNHPTKTNSACMYWARIIQNPNEHIQGSLTELLFDLEELVILDWQDGEDKQVIVLATMRNQMRQDGISCTVKHMSAIVSVSAAGESRTRP
jgi:hypothetical protein